MLDYFYLPTNTTKLSASSTRINILELPTYATSYKLILYNITSASNLIPLSIAPSRRGSYKTENSS